MPERLKSARGWLVGAVLGTGVAAWLSVAAASHNYLEFSGRLGVAGIAITLGSAEVAYLVWRNWLLGQRGPAKAAAAGASLGSLLILVSTLGGVKGEGFATMASGVGLLGAATAIGLFGVYRATGKSTAGTATAMVIVLALAYFASVLWAAVP
ncbi:MAG: hypothetical protein HGA51_03165 [Demequinaceae bacterium]|nr:hypothetical protein [Demequinaceae bacterium]